MGATPTKKNKESTAPATSFLTRSKRDIHQQEQSPLRSVDIPVVDSILNYATVETLLASGMRESYHLDVRRVIEKNFRNTCWFYHKAFDRADDVPVIVKNLTGLWIQDIPKLSGRETRFIFFISKRNIEVHAISNSVSFETICHPSFFNGRKGVPATYKLFSGTGRYVFELRTISDHPALRNETFVVNKSTGVWSLVGFARKRKSENENEKNKETVDDTHYVYQPIPNRELLRFD